MKTLSNACVYGLRALIYMALKEDTSQFVSIREISEKMDISFHFLTKTFQTLTERGLLKSYRGPKGGVAFEKEPSDIFLIDVVKIIDGEDFFDICLLGLPGCGEETPCPVHDFWKTTKDTMKLEFETTSLADLAEKVHRKRLRIND
ncbi:MAG: Rrf2 family transcriptional regulator [Saprospiraceae bacterium]